MEKKMAKRNWNSIMVRLDVVERLREIAKANGIFVSELSAKILENWLENPTPLVFKKVVTKTEEIEITVK